MCCYKIVLSSLIYPTHLISIHICCQHYPPWELLAWEIVMWVRPATRAPSAANCKKSTHHWCKICGKPTHNGQKLDNFEGKLPFFTPKWRENFQKDTHDRCWDAQKSPIIGADLFKNPPISAHICRYPKYGSTPAGHYPNRL